MTTQINLNNIIKDVVEHEIENGNLSAVIPQNLNETLNKLVSLYEELTNNGENEIIKKSFFDSTITGIYQDLSNTFLSNVNYSEINNLFMTEEEERIFINDINKYLEDHPEELSIIAEDFEPITSRNISNRAYENCSSYDSGFADGMACYQANYTPNEFWDKCAEIQNKINDDTNYPDKDEECNYLSDITDICDNYKLIQENIIQFFEKVMSNDQFLAYNVGVIAGFCKKADIIISNRFNTKDKSILNSLVVTSKDKAKRIGEYRLEKHAIGTIGYNVIKNKIDTLGLLCPNPESNFEISANTYFPYLYTYETKNNNYGWNELIKKYATLITEEKVKDTHKLLMSLLAGPLLAFLFIINMPDTQYFGGIPFFIYTIEKENLGKRIVDLQLLDKLILLYGSFAKNILEQLKNCAIALHELCSIHYEFHADRNCSKDTEWYGKESQAPLSADICHCHDKNIELAKEITEDDLPEGFKLDNGLIKYKTIARHEIYCNRTEEDGCAAENEHKVDGSWSNHVYLGTISTEIEHTACLYHDDIPELPSGEYDEELSAYVTYSEYPVPQSILEQYGHGDPTYFPVDVNVHE